jgi:acyl transferase domain-containing protein/acyl carrier protein
VIVSSRKVARRWRDIAIIGMTGRFPGGGGVDRLWHNLETGKDCITHFTDDELLQVGVSRHLVEHPQYVKAAPLLADYDRFDAGLFNFAPGEAALIDPQHRIFLECAWEAMELAGYSTGTERLRTAVFAGSALNTYLIFGLLEELRDNFIPTLIANDKDFLATRVSHRLNLTGPSVTIQTACSTSLVAIHFACASLINGESDLALAGGVAVKVPQVAGYMYKEGSIVSRDGRCRPFDAAAAGTVFGSGAGVVALRRLDDAIADRDTILAVIKGTAVNNDGADKASYAAPRVASQTAAVIDALSAGGTGADSLSYIEAHGTGTRLGDPIEVQALSGAFRPYSRSSQFCWLGSVKANVGHLDAAAGVTGLIKCVLAMQHGCIPPNPYFRVPNPELELDRSPFKISDRLELWPRGSAPRRAAVNGLGAGGTNAFVVLEEAPTPAPRSASRPLQILTISAKTPLALERQRRNLSALFREGKVSCPADVCFTLHVGRHAFAHRAALVAATDSDVRIIAERIDGPDLKQAICERSDRPVAFVLPGERSSRHRQGWTLNGCEPQIRTGFDACIDLLPESATTEALRAAAVGEIDPNDDGPLRPSFVIVGDFILSVVLAQFWMALGLTPAAIVGRGIGALAAGCIGKAFPLERALLIASHWGICADAAAARGEMPLETFRGSARESDGLLDLLRATNLDVSSIPIMSTAEAGWIDAASMIDPWFWYSELCCNTGWEEAMQRLDSELRPTRLWIPNDEMLASAAGGGESNLSRQQTYQTLASLWLGGAAINWQQFHRGDNCGRVATPAYPFERQRHWVKSNAAIDNTGAFPEGEKPHLSRNQLFREPRRQQTLDAGRISFKGHIPGPLHRALAKMWTDILGVAEVGLSDDFFELGGDSLMLVDLLEKVNSTFGIDLPITTLFESPTIEELANLIERVSGDAAPVR